MTSENQVIQQSRSMPTGVDSTGLVIDATDQKKPARNILNIKIQMLDNSITIFQIQHKAIGKVLFEQVCRMLNLLESDYFGLEYLDRNNTKYWLDYEKRMNRQIGLTLIDPVLYFRVKFYTPDPAQLEEPYTRYLFSLQIKYDMAEGILQCNDNTSALMSSYIIQSECGDYMEEDYPDHSHISSSKFVPHQDAEMERRIMEHYRKHKGQTPEVADLNLLEIARRCELYGIRMSRAKDHEGMPLFLAVAHMGILVFQNYTKINTFSWAKIRKLSFKKKRFLIKLHSESHAYYKDPVEFYFEGRNECKNFWKKCIEHHGFFRCSVVRTLPRQKTRVFSRGSSFRYSGKTQKEVVDYVRSNFMKRQPFQRSASFKMQRQSGREAHVTMGRSISTHLPISESEQNFAQHQNATSTPVSQSCGSVTLTDKSGDELSPSKELPLDTPFNQKRSSSLKKVDGHPPADDMPPSYIDAISKQAIDLVPIPETSPAEEIGSPEEEEEEEEEDDDKEKEEEEEKVDCHTEESRELDSNESTDDKAVPENPFVNETLSANEIDMPVSPRSTIHRTLSKRQIKNQAYLILKELVMTERTFKKDLEVLAVWFRETMDQIEGMPEDILFYLFSHIDPIYKLQEQFLTNVEQRLTMWEGKLNVDNANEYQRIGDLMLDHLTILKLFKNYATCQEDIIDRLHMTFSRNKKFEQVYKNFEMQKVCYLPLTMFILKPVQRLFHYQSLIERLMEYYEPEHIDFADCKMSLERIQESVDGLHTSLFKAEHGAKLLELQRDLIGFDSLINPKRKFIREGSLQKYSKKGFQQRIFFLFSDVLIYANKVSSSSLQFKVHSHIPVSGMVVESSENKLGSNHCFTIYGGNQNLLLSALSEDQKIRWLDDLSQAIKDSENTGSLLFDNNHNSNTDLNSQYSPHESDTKQNSQRSNTTVQVCWHRNTSVGMDDFLTASYNNMSGYLLRKFKNSNGWQKLWVVFTNFCMFFYKSYQNEFPLASLPLLGYSVDSPSQADGIKKEFVFKLQFKYHVYFFRAESEYAYQRWIEVLKSATISPETENFNGNYDEAIENEE